MSSSCIEQARQEQRCVIATDNAQAQMLRRRLRVGQLVEPYSGLFVQSDVWNGLNVKQRSQYMVRSLALKHPNWIFAGLSAAAMFGFKYPRELHRDSQIFVATVASHNKRKHNQLQYIRMRGVQPTVFGGVRLTTPERTLADCARRFGFCDMLPMVDSALRLGLTTKEQMAEHEASLPRRLRRIDRLIEFSDARSESGGESACRAMMLESGFPVPRMQIEHSDPRDRSKLYRTDFEFSACNGDIVVVEYDGMQKYVDPKMTHNRGVAAVVSREQERERALYADGVSKILRFDYVDVMKRTPVVKALESADIERTWPLKSV